MITMNKWIKKLKAVGNSRAGEP